LAVAGAVVAGVAGVVLVLLLLLALVAAEHLVEEAAELGAGEAEQGEEQDEVSHFIFRRVGCFS
jgi:hypothetical protein